MYVIIYLETLRCQKQSLFVFNDILSMNCFLDVYLNNTKLQEQNAVLFRARLGIYLLMYFIKIRKQKVWIEWSEKAAAVAN